MRKGIFLLMLAAAAVSCSDGTLDAVGGGGEAASDQGVTFTFDAVTAPEAWSRHQSLEEMLAACQIPEDKLAAMPTEELAEVCMSHPLRILYAAYDNELDGAEVVFSNFNGFRELEERPDAPRALLSLYEEMNFGDDGVALRKELRTLSGKGFMELYLASGELPALYQGAEREALEQLSGRVLEKKLGEPGQGMRTISRSLLIGARVKLSGGAVTAAEAAELRRFVETGGRSDTAKDYERVSEIIAK